MGIKLPVNDTTLQETAGMPDHWPFYTQTPTVPVRDGRYDVAFLFRFVLVFSVLILGYFQIPVRVLADALYPALYAQPGQWLITALFPEEPVSVQGRFLIAPQARLEIVRGCDGAGALLLLASAMLASAAGWKHKAVGLLASVLVLYPLNLLRIVGLYFLVAYQPAWFLPVHVYFAPTLILVAGGLIFLSWRRWRGDGSA